MDAKLEQKARESYSEIIKALSVLLTMPRTDEMFDANVVPRDPMLEQVTRIRTYADKLRDCALTHGQGSVGEGFVVVPYPATEAMVEATRKVKGVQGQPSYNSARDRLNAGIRAALAARPGAEGG